MSSSDALTARTAIHKSSTVQLLVVLAFTCSIAIFAGPLCAQQSNFFIRTIDDPNAVPSGFGGGASTQAHGINDAGTVVGVYSTSNNTFHAFQYSGGQFLPANFDFPGPCSFSCGTEANGINNAGEVVGDYTDASGVTHGYYSLNGSYFNLDVSGAVLTIATGVNNNGVIVGFYVDINNVQHGFQLNGGQISRLDVPNCTNTSIRGINDLGDVVGNCSAGGFKYRPMTGALTRIAAPGAFSTSPAGINNAGQIVGSFLDATSHFHGFLLSNGSATTVDAKGAQVTELSGINNHGQFVGDWIDNQSADHGLLGGGPQLVDPIPDMLAGPSTANNTLLQSLGLFGHVVGGVAADGVTQIFVRIPAKQIGDQFTLALLNDAQQVSISSDEDGALGNPGSTGFTQSVVTVFAIGVNTAGSSQVPLAFAVYRAPIDFARRNGDGSFKNGICSFLSSGSGWGAVASGASLEGPPNVLTDDQLACRSVSIRVQDLSSGATSTLPITILRPPVVLVHGLWDSWSTWNNFSPLVSGPNKVDSRFHVGRASYDGVIGPSIVASDPSYSRRLLQHVRANSLGFGFNAPNVLAQIDQWIESFKNGNNPLGIASAGVQADIVAHSMGGDITRAMVLQPTFLSDSTLGQGSIHKLITIDTPHLGSPVATLLLSPQESGGCAQTLLALFGDFTFNAVSLGQRAVSGAIADLSESSPALRNIANQNLRPLQTAFIAGVYTNFSSLGGGGALGHICGAAGDPIALNLSATRWPTVVFNNQPNDAIVSENSQLNGSVSGFIFTGFLHSKGVKDLGFTGATMLDPDSITGVPSTTILLLNTPLTNASFHSLNP